MLTATFLRWLPGHGARCRGRSSSAGGAALVDLRGAGSGVEAPVVAVGVEGQAEDAERVVPPDLAVGLRVLEPAQVATPGAHHELRHPLLGGGPSGVALGGEAFVAVFVSVQHDIDARVLQDLPEAGDALVVAPLVSGGEPGSVERRERAACGALGQVGGQPFALVAVGVAVDLLALGVEDDDVPGAHVEGVPALAGCSGAVAEVVPVGVGAVAVVLVVADQGVGLVEEPTPAPLVALP